VVEQPVGLVVGAQQRLDAPPHLGVTTAGLVQVGRAPVGRGVQGRQEDGLDLVWHGGLLDEAIR
jgi:hypothetical protein